MLCKITQNSLGQTPGGKGYPARSNWGGRGTLSGPAGGGGIPCQVQLGGGTLPGLAREVPCQVQPGGGYPAGGYPARWAVPCWGSMGGFPAGLGGTLPGGTPLARSGWGYPAKGGTLLGGTLPGYPPRQGTPQPRSGGGGYPVRTTKGVLTTRRAVCLLRSRRRTFLFLSK